MGSSKAMVKQLTKILKPLIEIKIITSSTPDTKLEGKC